MNWIFAAALFACLVQSPAAYGAETFPDRPIKLVVPSPPGGPPDIMARLLTDEMRVALGEPVVVENRAGGAGGLIGARTVLGAEPDGYTILMGSTSALLTAPLIHKDAGYNAASFAPIANLSETVEVLSVNPFVPAHSAAELVSLAKTQPGMLHFSSAGTGSLPHLEGELLKAQARVDMVHVPYRGGGPALVGLLGGEVQFLFSALTQMLPYINDGRLRGLAVTSATRSTLVPDIPTMVESGFDGFVTAGINFLVAPPGTPIEARRKLSDAATHALTSAQVKAAFDKLGAREIPGTPEQLTAYLAEQQVRWAKIVAMTKISVE